MMNVPEKVVAPFRLHRYSVFVFLVAMIYGVGLAFLPLDVFSDRVNYRSYTENSWDILQGYWDKGLLVGVFNEPIWLGINSFLKYFFSSDTVLRIIIFAPSVVLAWYVLRYDSRYFFILLCFLLLPQVVSYHIAGLRQGVAISVFVAGWFSPSRSVRWGLLGITPFIHASFFFIVFLLGLIFFSRYLRLSVFLRLLLFLVAGVAVSVSVEWLSSFLGARQAEVFSFSSVSVSGLGFLFWSVVLSLMCLQGRDYMQRYMFESGALVFYLSTYFFLEISGRIFESALVLVLLAGLGLSDWRRLFFVVMIFVYGLSQYAIRLREPWLGFGAV